MRLAVVVVLALARAAHADCPASGTKQLPIARGAVTIDGVLDDRTWTSACAISDFTQKQPVFGAPPTHPLRVMVAIDDRTLYIGARMWSRDVADISDALTQRDDTSQAERLIISLDPQHTKRLAYSFAVTARGVRADWIHTDDDEFTRDSSWNPVWRAEARILADGWTAEMAIPLSQLRLPSTPVASWGFNVNWYIPHRQEDVFWISVPRDRTAWASWFGELTNLPPIRAGVPLELLPYVASRIGFDESQPTTRLASRWFAGFDAGLDVKLRPLPAFSVTATLNPDFGQVEADPSFVNLTAFEVRLPERRPFFIENNALLANAGAAYFYSRRIGALPRYQPEADVLAAPQQVRILGAIAAGGFVVPSTQIAVLGAVTDRTTADAIVAGRAAELVVAPVTGWAAARIEHQIGASVIGATATAVGRALDGSDLETLLPSSSFVVGGDARLRSEDRTYELGFVGGVTSILGSGAALALVQQNSTHWFQRPDATHVDVDPSRRSMTGWHAGVVGAKRAGSWQGTAIVNLESPDYDINELGQLASADDIDGGIDVTRIDTVSSKRVFQWSAGGGAYTATNFDGLLKPLELYGRGDITFASFNNAAISARVFTPGQSDDLTRGGPRMGTGWAGSTSLNVSTPGGRARQLSASTTIEISPTLQQGVHVGVGLTSRLTPSLRLDVRPTVSIVESHRQYVTTVDDSYVFGHIKRREASVELRATWSLSPDLVLTFYAQPFYSHGAYESFGQLRAPGSDELDPVAPSVTFADPDFRITSLRSTAVLRYEPQPGSTLFVVWQQAREAERAVHTLALKLSWWFG